ncbi:MAG TPA: hypothetical protein VIR01_06085 [Pyrinomonadaceae bacterium]
MTPTIADDNSGLRSISEMRACNSPIDLVVALVLGAGVGAGGSIGCGGPSGTGVGEAAGEGLTVGAGTGKV